MICLSLRILSKQNGPAAVSSALSGSPVEKCIPFESVQTADPFFSEANTAYVKKSVQELKAGKGTVHETLEVDE